MSQVTESLETRGVPFQVLRHEPTHAAGEEARSLGIGLDQVVKTIVLRTAEGPVIALVPGSRRLDMSLVRHAVGDPHARLATEAELQRDYPGFLLGAMPPLGSLLRTRVYEDPETVAHPEVVFAVSPTESVRVRTEDLLRDEYPTVAPLCQGEP